MANFNPNDYETVDSRIKRFYQDHPDGRITTELVEAVGEVGSTRWTVKASIWRGNCDQCACDGQARPDGTGYAFEVDGSGMANKTSALENCETSAIGRALANISYSGDKRASREEMLKTQQVQADAQQVVAAISRIGSAESIDALQTIWNEVGATGVTRDPAVVAAKDARKKELADASANA